MLIRDERGGALVEMSISMLVIIPAVLYSTFLDDILRHKLEQQEAVTSSTWDFTMRDYQKGTDHAAAVQKHNRLTWCDHTSAYDSYKSMDSGYDCNDEGHHQAVAAHACWLGESDGQITCEHKGKGPRPGFDPAMIAGSFHDKFTKGGVYACKGQLSVLNYLVPNEWGQEFTDVPLFNRKKHSGSVHGASGGSGSENAFLLREEQFAVLTDTWAMNDIKSRKPGQKSGELYKRVNHVYSKNWAYYIFMFRGLSFFSAVTLSEGLVNPALACDPWFCVGEQLGGDSPFTPNLSITHSRAPKVTIKQDTGGGDYFATPWEDSETSPYKKTANNHENWYMGNKQPEQQ